MEWIRVEDIHPGMVIEIASEWLEIVRKEETKEGVKLFFQVKGETHHFDCRYRQEFKSVRREYP